MRGEMGIEESHGFLVFGSSSDGLVISQHADGGEKSASLIGTWTLDA